MTAHDELAVLDARVHEAEARYRDARLAVDRVWEVGNAVLRPLADYYRDVNFRRREPDEAEAHRLTRELLERVVREGLELLPLDPGRPAAGVKAHDPPSPRAGSG